MLTLNFVNFRTVFFNQTPKLMSYQQLIPIQNYQKKILTILLLNLMKPLNKNPQKQRMNIELNQIRSILNDFRKTKYKCVQLAKSIEIQMPKDEHFKNVQKTIMRKMDLLDITGLVNLKNQLVRGIIQSIKALTELFEIQRQLRYKKEKFDARKQIIETQKQETQYIKRNQYESAIQSPRNNQAKILEPSVRSIVSEPKKQQPEIEQAKPKHTNLQIPLYRAKNQINQNKLDRISKYIASLKRNMKLNSQTLGYKWKIKEFLIEDLNYMKLRAELERYMMREEELDNILSRTIHKGVKDYINKSQILQSTPQYKLIKVYKQNPLKIQKNTQFFSQQTKPDLTSSSGTDSPANLTTLTKSSKISSTLGETQFPQNFSFNSPKINKQSGQSVLQQPNNSSFTLPPKTNPSKIDIQSKAQQDFNSIKKELQKSTESYIQMLSKINQTVEKGSEKLIQMREKRKKKFQKDDDIWDQLDKI